MAFFLAPRLILRYNTRLELLRIWRRNLEDAEQLTTVLDVMLNAIGRYQARQVLLNLQKLPPFSLGLQEWLQRNWLPRLRRTGIQRLAVLLPIDVYNMMVVEGLLWSSTRQDLPYEVQYFSETAAVLDWLTNAELPSTDQDWARRSYPPRLLRARHRPPCRHRKSTISPA